MVPFFGQTCRFFFPFPSGWLVSAAAPSRREREGPPFREGFPVPFREQAEAAKASVASKEKAWPWREIDKREYGDHIFVLGWEGFSMFWKSSTKKKLEKLIEKGIFK